MNAKHLTLGLFGLALTPFVFAASASACTPAPDNPDGCDGINGGGRYPIVPRETLQLTPSIPPRPTCLSCPSLRDNVIQERINPSVLPTQQVNQIQPQIIQDHQYLNQQRGF